MNVFKLAVAGKDVAGSLSPAVHAFIAGQKGKNISYDKISLPPEKFGDEIGKLFAAYDGLNITAPYKTEIIPFLKKISGDAAACGAVNAVTCRSLSGYNTDGAGFMLFLEYNGLDFRGENVLLLGAGGAGRSVALKLAEAGARVDVYSRRFKKSLSLSEISPGIAAVETTGNKEYAAVINATGVGMWNTEGSSPVDEKTIKRCGVAIELIYKPEVSGFLKIALSEGKRIFNGVGMLFFQAYLAQCIFFGESPDASEAARLFCKYKTENGI